MQLVTISSQRQITIPMVMLDQLGWIKRQIIFND